MPRSFRASMTSEMLPCWRYRTPPWTSLVDRLEVPLPKSLCSTRQTEYPRDAASTATPTPVAPPPMTAMSHGQSRASNRASEVLRFIVATSANCRVYAPETLGVWEDESRQATETRRHRGVPELPRRDASWIL